MGYGSTIKFILYILDPVLKNKVHDQLEHNFSQESFHNVDPPSLQHHPTPIEMVAETNSNKIKIPKCESYIKTGDRVFKLSLNAEVKYFIAFLFQNCNVCYYF